MVDLAEKRLTVNEFLVWAEGREGKWELLDGSPTAMSPERVRHTQTKTEAGFALREAARRAGASCRAFVDGITLRISDDRAFSRCGRRVSAAAPPRGSRSTIR
jgi:Uma2 family endonuclease